MKAIVIEKRTGCEIRNIEKESDAMEKALAEQLEDIERIFGAQWEW